MNQPLLDTGLVDRSTQETGIGPYAFLNFTSLQAGKPLSGREVSYCRDAGIPLGYDNSRAGWVPVNLFDEMGILQQQPLLNSSNLSRHVVLDILGQELRQSLETDSSQAITVKEAFARARKTISTTVTELHTGLEGDADLHFRNECFLHLYREAGDACESAGVQAIQDKAISFRPWEASEASTYLSLIGNPNVWRFLPEDAPAGLTEEDVSQLFEFAALDKGQEIFSVRFEDEIVGQIRLLFDSSNTSTRSAEVTYILGEGFWGRGLMSRILPQFLSFAFDEYDLDLITAWIKPENAASMRCAAQAGFSREPFNGERELSRLVKRAGFERYLCHRAAYSTRHLQLVSG